ncbi:MAG TPA: maleylpyruvate isomerase N-terminal domain-containing protein [Candidatus Paceibacterota bacterium]|nr:maleylpyruvate isomerase N-terminal domain-containing protein [Candidatus Paceibacterota bacterium]
MDFIAYLKTLQPDDWNRMATPKWTVKDVVAHMVGWERGDIEEIERIWKTKAPPWWKANPDYDSFNRKWVEFYKDYTPAELITEWELWQKKMEEEVDKIGYDNLKAHPELFGWLIEDGDQYTLSQGGSHYRHHYEQVKKVVNKR